MSGPTRPSARAATLQAIEAYLDRAPRAAARVERIGPLDLFVSRGGRPYYARPALGRESAIAVDDVCRVVARQRQLGVPRSIEWLDELAPELGRSARAAGMTLGEAPVLLAAGSSPAVAPGDAGLRMLEADDRDLATVLSVVDRAFGGSGGAVVVEHHRRQLAAGLIRTCGAFLSGGAVGGGSHVPRDDVSEIVGVAVGASHRRRGLGAAITAALVADATGRGARLVFCSAGTPEALRVYLRLGFRRIGTAVTAQAR